MKKLTSLLAIFLSGSLFVSCSNVAQAESIQQYSKSPDPATYDTPWAYLDSLRDLGPVDPDVAQAIQNFSKSSFQNLVSSAETDNVLYAPLSLYMDLSMLADASAGQSLTLLEETLNGGLDISSEERQEAMKRIMQSFNREITEGDQMSLLSNAIWLKDGLKYTDAYAKILEDYYQADSYTWAPGSETDANQAMGKWVEDKTNKLLDASAIPETLPGPSTIMVLLNALYLRSSWAFPFDAAANTDGQFTTATGDEVDVTYMKQTIPKSLAKVYDEFTVAEILMGDQSKLRFILPAEGQDPKVLVMEDLLKDELLSKGGEDADVTWSIPKMDAGGQMDLLPLLAQLGLEDLTKSLDLSAGLTGSQDAFLSEATQAVRVTMDEKGVEAAAVTVLGVDESAAMDPIKVTMNLNRPFYCAMVNADGQVVFMGYITNP